MTVFNGAMQVNVKRVRKCHEDEYDPAEYLPMTPFNIDEMFARLLDIIQTIENTYCRQLLEYFFVKDEDFAKKLEEVASDSAGKQMLEFAIAMYEKNNTD